MKYKIGFVGLGKLGLPCAEAIAKKGHEVRGYDIDRVQSDVVKVDSTLKESVENRTLYLLRFQLRTKKNMMADNPHVT